MFGKNQLLRQERQGGDRLWVQEVFPTIQGEGPFAGRPAVFVRLAGCNLACYFCDTDFESSTWRPTLDELVPKICADAATAGHTRLVVLTGGEPFRQNIAPLCKILVEEGDFHVQIETAGSLNLPDLWDAGPRVVSQVTTVCSPKTGRLNPILENHITAYKYIINRNEPVDEADGLPMFSTQQQGRKMKLARPIGDRPVYLQPMDMQDPHENAENARYTAALCMKHGYKLCLQMHKIVGLP